MGCGRSPLLIADGEGGWSGSGRDDDDPWDVDDGDGDGGGGGGGKQMCREVDFLFVIDDSDSMQYYQNNVVNNYDVFIDGIRDAIDTIDTIHIGVIVTEAYWHNDTHCDMLGGLVIQTGGPHSSDAKCGPYREGANFMTDRDNLATAFPCAATVGTGGTDLDTPLAAIVSAVSPPLTNEGQCNHGFIGSGALLVMVIVTDTYPNAFGVMDIDPYFAGSVLLENVGGYDDMVVVLIASTESSPCLNPLQPGLSTFAEMFDHSYQGAICEKDFSKVFLPAIEVVKDACRQ